MLDVFLIDALQRLDRRVLEVCAEEERRAEKLAGGGGRGWTAVRNLVRPSVADLVGQPADRAGLLPGGPHVLRRIGAALGLVECELEALVVLFAPHVEPRYQSVYAVLQDDLHQPRATERVLHAILGRDAERHRLLATSLGAAGRLVRSGLVVRLPGAFAPLARPLDLPEDLVAALFGAPEPPVPQALGQYWTSGSGEPPGLREDAGVPPSPALQVVFGHGDLVETARSFVPRQRRLVVVGVPAAAADATAVAAAAWRAGLCTGALPLLDLTAVQEAEVGSVVRSVEDLVAFGGAAWLLCRDPLAVPVPHVEALPAGWAGRRDTWLAEASARGVALTPGEAGALAARHRLDGRGVRRVLDVATDGGATADADALDAVAAGMGVEHVRHSRRTIPTRGFDDLVLRPTTREALDRLVHYVKHRDQLAEDLGLERRYRLQRGPVALFSGVSGTGKTLAAEAVAAALGRPLHTVDVARLVSKYIGETEKNVDEVMSQAERASAVLFFDEADSLFGNRTERTSNAGDHFANMLVGYLLQRIEQHDGPTILATNLRGGIDEAFLRRFQFRIEFPFPGADERERIWELMLPERVVRADDVDLGRLAKAHRLAGGDIRNAALKAVFLAHRRGAPVGQDDLERAIALELLEMGRLSRQPDGALSGPRLPDRGELLRTGLDDLHDQLAVCLRQRFLKEIHVVHGSPTDELLTGKKPAVSVALFRVAARRGADGLRAGLIVSAWSHRAEEESELLGVVHEALTGMALAPVHGRQARLRVQESHDFDLLHRFWSSHGHPVRPSVVLDVEIE
ncbi:ATPase family associated with various cellular activities (AAA) [Micromonospora pattaloongensis]|uniref:ATPase family associated with various cellular activities (AAA) n=1 Tax=Micromonospora pattaloongensis TaxID=405436 RepID=A0A1H3QPU3_9ACTN|nr:ATP-binding protein [Micromonospora pattaloongensis]SDZ15081.1 ATPase family associated with various cellular activities (AAA) [Micromonospora pattaloongensis]